MPKADKKLQQARITFLADRFALLMVELVRRDCDYGPFCFDDFYEGKQAQKIRRSQHYHVTLDFVRNMLRRHDDG